jgi:hypothetical protein
VRAAIQPPPPYDARDIDVSTISVFGTLFANLHPVDFDDGNGDGIEEMVVKFDRAAFQALAPAGEDVQVTVTGEVRDTMWFTGTTHISAIRPSVLSPNGGEYLVAGQPVFITWHQPAMAPESDYDVYLSLDDGFSWELLGSVQGLTSMEWTVPDAGTDRARVRVYAKNGLLVMGYDESDAPFTIAASLAPPAAVSELSLLPDDAGTMLEWKRPLSDPFHGPAESYQVLVSEQPQGPFQLVAEVHTESYLEPPGTHPAGMLRYYKVVAKNAAGLSP